MIWIPGENLHGSSQAITFILGGHFMALATRVTLVERIANASRELRLFAVTSFVMGIAYSMFDSMFNNFLNERYSPSGFQRSFLEFPRELPGFSVVFVSAGLWFLCSRRLGGVAMLISAGGALLIGFLSPSYGVMVIWLFIYSLGQHLFMPLAASIGMDLAKEGKTGQRLGQLNAVRNMAAILGSFLVFLGFRFFGLTFQHYFVMAAVGFVISALLLFRMKPQQPQPANTFLKLHREYRLFYFLAVLYGSRKQLFITFAPWVLVTVFHQPTQLLATLFTIGGITGILFQPLLGWTIDRLGERFVLASEALLLIFVCIGYGFAGRVFPEGTAFIIVCACFLLDNMLMSVGMARSTYIKKTALDPSHVQPALTASVTIDHIFSISVALLGGLVWNFFGYQYVFLGGAVIAAVNLVAALQVRLPKSSPKIPLPES
jgi:predicted MFS family arabinose efflux permease